ncbi:hypothetical protein MA04_02114 [Alcanivorax balearicus MACL04]|uniref:Uncharacterized protein n=1 Tax=Alloalcanivorax balearicus MACL04 TaxID=1177182 RepID=A0ABT2QZ82_9GAMM|nr:hypothetical protein [Alloalcanivorax balearicus]MCU5782814.1 hypothetical protein [Alloalcanivorax balearicus MACL04]
MNADDKNRRTDKRPSPPSDLESMLNDDEALEGVEAWLNQQTLLIKLSSHKTAHPSTTLVESPAGWLLRLVLSARAELASQRKRYE